LGYVVYILEEILAGKETQVEWKAEVKDRPMFPVFGLRGALFNPVATAGVHQLNGATSTMVKVSNIVQPLNSEDFRFGANREKENLPSTTVPFSVAYHLGHSRERHKHGITALYVDDDLTDTWAPRLVIAQTTDDLLLNELGPSVAQYHINNTRKFTTDEIECEVLQVEGDPGD
jgi:hypothetical protein